MQAKIAMPYLHFDKKKIKKNSYAINPDFAAYESWKGDAASELSGFPCQRTARKPPGSCGCTCLPGKKDINVI